MCETCRAEIVDIHLHTGHLGGFGIEPEEILVANDLNNLTLQVSGQGQDISFLIKLAKSTSLLCTFLLEFIETIEGVEPEANSNEFYGVFKAQTQALRDLVKSRFCKTQHYVNSSEDFARLIAIQNQSVYNMIAQRDTQQNIELAKDSKSIAAASKRDSSAMKSIALLTMVVLPGTLISTIFAMPLFNWSASSWSQIPSSRFWFYWAITIPLMITILIIWIIWQRMYERRSKILDAEAREGVGLKKERSPRSSSDVESTANQVLSHPVPSGSRSEPRLPMSNNSDVRLRALESNGRRETV